MTEIEKQRIGKFDIQEANRIAGKDLLESSKNITENVEIQTKANTRLINEARDQSFQERTNTDETQHPSSSVSRSILNSLGFLMQSGDLLPAWWSTRRDIALGDFWKSVNLLSSAMYTLTSKMTTIPFHIAPRDMAITSHFKEAARFEAKLMESVEFGEGWGQFFSKQVQSLLGQDNGRFMEILDGSNDKSGPLRPPALSVAHIDPQRCMRTRDQEFPIVYTQRNGNFHKIHYTRVAFQASLPSIEEDMLGVGFCAVSRSSAYAQNLLDMSQYKEEKLGSRPTRGVLLAGGGLDGEMVGEAWALAGESSDNAGLKRFSRLPILGSPDIPEPSLELISLSSLPDGFEEMDATSIAMAAIALGFGVDARELWPAIQKGATRADALLAHIKQRGKGPGQILVETERMFNQYFLPSYLQMIFDVQDDAQDRQRAEISKERAITRKTDISLRVTTARTERQTMVVDGEISDAQFKDLELQDGRLPDGTPLATVFFKDDPIYTEILNLKLENPLNIRSNDPEKALDAISAQIPVAMEILSKETRQIQQRQAREALAALENLAEEYTSVLALQSLEEEEIEVPTSENRQGVREGAKSNPEDEKPVTARSNSEQNLNQELSPREFTGKSITNIKRDRKGRIKSFKIKD